MLELPNQLDGFDNRGDVKVMATNRVDSLKPQYLSNLDELTTRLNFRDLKINVPINLYLLVCFELL